MLARRRSSQSPISGKRIKAIWRISYAILNGCLITNAWNPTGCRASMNYRCADAGAALLQPTSIRHEYNSKTRQWESNDTSTRKDSPKSNGWKVHRWDLVASMLCLQRLATPGWWQMAKGWHLRTNGEWQLSTSCAQVQWRIAKHKPIELTILTDLPYRLSLNRWMLSRINEFEDNEVHELPPWLKSIGLT